MFRLLSRAYCDHVLSMLEECQRGPGPNFWSFNIAISACSRAGRWQQAIDFLEARHLLRRLAMWVLRSCAARATSRTSIARPSAPRFAGGRGFTSAISGCKASSNQAVELLRSMQDARLQASIVTYGAVISSRAGNGDWKGALALLDEAPRPFCDAFLILFDPFLASSTLREARDQGLEITTIAFNAVLDSWGPPIWG